MATETLYRKADISRADATASLFKRFPSADLVSFEKVAATAEAARTAGVREGDEVYAATIRTAEFPPESNDGGDEGGDSSESKPAPKEKSETKDDSDSDDDGGSDDSAPDFGGGDGGDGELGKPKKLDPAEETVHLLHQILDAIKGGGGLGGPGGPGDLDLPDVGAPGQGETLPPPGPGGHSAPLPPPVKDKSPVGVGAFAHFNASAAEVNVVRSDANEVGNRALIKEAAEVYPTHRVSKIERTGFKHINGEEIDIAEAGIAVVTLTRK